MASAKFQLSPDGGLSWLATDVPLASGLGIAQGVGNASVYARLASLAGVDTVSWSIVAASENAAELTLVTYPDKSVHILVPIDSAATWILRAVVNGGIDPLTQRPSPTLVSALAIKVLTDGGMELLAPGEGDEGDRAFGWTTAFNALALAGIGSGTATRVRANASGFLSGDVTFAQGTNVTLSQVGSTITINASGGGSGLPSPYTATVPPSGEFIDGLLITGPSGSYPYPGSPPPPVVIRGRDNTDTVTDAQGGDVMLVGGDLPAGSASGNGGGIAWVRGGNGPFAGSGWVTGGLTLVDGGTAGNASVFGRSGNDHAALTNVTGGDAGVYGGDGKGTGGSGSVSIAGGSGTSSGGNVSCQGGSGATPGTAALFGGNGSSGVGGACTVGGGSGAGSGTGGACSVTGGAASAGNGGALALTGGASSGGTSKAGGSVTIDGGAASGTTGAGGYVQITGGAGSATGGQVGLAGGAGPVGGTLYCVAGTSSGANTGGSASYLGGSGGSTGNGGGALLGGGASGNGGTSKVGGSATVQGGTGSGTTGIGGDAVVAGGTGTGTGGDVRLTPGGGAGSTFGKTRVTRGAFEVGESNGTVKQISETCAPVTTTSTTATLVWSYALGTSENLWITVQATGDPGTAAATGAVTYTAQFRRTTGDNSGAAQQCGTTQDMSPNGGVAKNGFSVTITLNTNTVEVKVVAPNTTSTLWAVAVGGLARTGPV